MRVSREQRAEIEKALRHVREHFAEALRVEEVVRRTSFSESWFRKVFHAATGRGVVDYLNELRIERARELLRTTGLPVMEVAFQVGFRNLGYFTRTFKKATGSPPAAFRRTVRRRVEDEPAAERPASETVFRDDLRSRRPEWKPLYGEWRWERGRLRGTAAEGMEIGLDSLLPESFEIRLRFRVAAKADPDYGLSLRLRDPEFSRISYRVNVGETRNRIGFLVTAEGDTVRNEKALLAPGRDQELRVVFDAPLVEVFLDDERLFSCREAFPSGYGERCKFSIWFWQRELSLLGLEILDRGLPGSLPTVRVGDTLFKEGMVARAESFYRELLRRVEDEEEEKELRYKIGNTRLEQGDEDAAEAWLRRVADLPGDGFWENRARLALLRRHCRRGEGEAAPHYAAGVRSSHPALSASAGSVLAEEAEALLRHGFYERALRLYAASIESSGVGWGETGALRRASECAGALRRYGEAVRYLERLGRGVARGTLVEFTARIQIAFVRSLQGRFGEAERVLERIRESARDARQEILLQYGFLAIRRGQGNVAALERILRDMEKSYGGLGGDVAAGIVVHRSQLLCVTGRTAEARRALEGAGNDLSPEAAALSFYLTWALEQEYVKAWEAYSVGYRVERRFVPGAAIVGLVGGILLSLGDDLREARSLWMDVSRRFPPDRVCHLATIADALTQNRNVEETVRAMPYDTFVRGEIAYWVALWLEKRGDGAGARRTLELAVSEDPTRRWPAELARRRLAHGPSVR